MSKLTNAKEKEKERKREREKERKREREKRHRMENGGCISASHLLSPPACHELPDQSMHESKFHGWALCKMYQP